MKYNVDSYFELGNNHNICEDYALHGIVSDVPYIIISDGCSSSKDTDIGARIIAHSIKNVLIEILNKNLLKEIDTYVQLRLYLKEQILFNVKSALKSLCLPNTVADATAMLAFIWDEHLYYFIFGDGHIIIKHDNGNIKHDISYSENAPPYISYDLDISRKLAYIEKYGNTNMNHVITENNDTNTTRAICTTLDDWIFDKDACYFRKMPINDIKSITLSSDGIESYQSTGNSNEINNINWHEEYTNYKSTAGEFVKRRMKRIKLNNKNMSIEHFDDVSCATIWINRE